MLVDAKRRKRTREFGLPLIRRTRRQVPCAAAVGDEQRPFRTLGPEQQEDCCRMHVQPVRVHVGDARGVHGIRRLRQQRGRARRHARVREELRQAIIAQKQKANPNYGTIWNMGNIFSGE